MKCFESQTASKRANPIAAEKPRPSALEDQRLHQLATQFEAMLMTVVMRPMTKSMGPMSEVVAQQMALQVASGTSDPLYEQLKDQIG